MSRNITIQPVQLPEHYERMAQLLNLVYTEPTSAAILAEEDGKLYKKGSTSLDEEGRLIGYDRIRLAALSADGHVLGYANGWRAPWTEPGTLHNTVVVDAAYWNQGVGTRLVQALEQWAHDLNASEMTVMVSDEDEAAQAFAERRGYVKDRHTFKSTILPTHFNEDTGKRRRTTASG
ncbi:GNAT family N-acetyltransferase [Paenibacillus rigui]|uniref:N-acetyltransferase domain-containing protein n=1 Tax=Paenibacillus rigui TaxID=554312 RepID=A0A229UHG1_9BACL|nr:GNAT family N-acetyltransferase [Paenibacillus rigui]OXM82846.1 hypothetical protein CF651_28825 [Paenibacillus rigui]